MEKKIVYIKEKEISKKAQENFDAINAYVQNPIKAKFLAFQKTKKEALKDLFD